MTNRIEQAAARAVSAALEAPQYREDSRGNKVRVFSKDAPLSWDEVRHFYLNRRVVDEEEALEAIGYNGFRTQVQSGNLVKSGAFYWVTKKAAARYKLPLPVVSTGAVCQFV